jgi:hypothetical protein
MLAMLDRLAVRVQAVARGKLVRKHLKAMLEVRVFWMDCGDHTFPWHYAWLGRGSRCCKRLGEQRLLVSSGCCAISACGVLRCAVLLCCMSRSRCIRASVRIQTATRTWLSNKWFKTYVGAIQRVQRWARSRARVRVWRRLRSGTPTTPRFRVMCK